MRVDLPILAFLHLPVLGLVLARTSGFFLTVPFFSAEAAPLPARGGIALAVAFVLYPLYELTALPSDIAGTVLLLSKEVAIGILLGGTVRIFFAALQLAGQLAGFGIGLSLAKTMDPSSSVENSVGPALYQYVGLMLFLSVGGHRHLLTAFIESYRILPMGEGALNGHLLQTIVALASDMFSVGLRLAAPVVALTFALDMMLAMANRVVPQIPILMIGMPVKTWLGLAALGWGLRAFAVPCIAWLGRAPELITKMSEMLASVP